MSPEKADLVLHEGAILGHPESDSIAVAGGWITAHGRFSELKAMVGPQSHLVKLGRRTVAPGFIDSHLHFLEAASAATGVSVWRCRTVPELLAELRAAAGKTPPGNWLRVFGCDEALLRERRGPTRQELDRAVGRNPLRMRHQTLHASWLNSRAITLLGLEGRDFKPPQGAVMVRDTSGRLAGLVAGMEQWITLRLPLVTATEIEARARLFSRELAAGGVTAFTDATVRNGPEEVALFAKLMGAGAIAQRTAMMIGEGNLDSVSEARRLAETAGIGLPAAKFMQTAGVDPGRLARRVETALKGGLDCAFHCTEIEELDAALAAFEHGRKLAGGGDRICRIEHASLIPPGYFDRLCAIGAWVVSNPGFIYYRGAKYASEPGLVPYLYRLKSLVRAGVEVAAGTDAPVTPAKPLVAIAAAAERVSFEGYDLAGEEQLPTDRSFDLFTGSAARLARLEGGEIGPRKLADLIVLPKDPLALAPAELMKMAVDMTIIGGKIVYERGRPAAASSARADLFSA
jgi:predicted amidohydrolase YtcJ